MRRDAKVDAAPLLEATARWARDPLPATAIAVIGRGEAQQLVKTADGVREPQNRRVEIVIQ